MDKIEQALKNPPPDVCGGDHGLNPGWSAPQSHRPAAVLILLVGAGDDLSVVFTERTPHLPTHGGQISFPGGKIETSDKDAIAAALREAAEETGMDTSIIRILGQTAPYITRSGFCVQPVVGHVAAMPDFHPDDREVARIFAVPLTHFIAAGNLVEQGVMQDGTERRYYASQWQDAYIWGATAGMLKNLLERIQ